MNNLIVISAPSGCGKTTLVKKLIQELGKLVVSISYTTRALRDGELDGIHYFFITKNKFDKLIKNNEFVEYAKVFDNMYGTSKQELQKSLLNNDTILEIDWQGFHQVKKHFSNIISIFILPTNMIELKDRLIKRGDDSDVISRRMLGAKEEISHANEYDYQVINDDFDIAFTELKNIILLKK